MRPGSPASASSAATPWPSSGSNRPKLYWSVMAAQMLGAVPVPVYADAVADEVAFVLAHSDARFAAVEDQEQVDKLLSVAERLPKLERIVYDERRGLRDYDHGRLRAIDDVISDGRGALAKEPALGQWLDREIEAGQGLGPFDHSLYVGHHGPVEGRRAVRHRLHQCRLRHGRFRPAHRSATRRSPICRSPGSATIISTMRKRWSRVSALPVRRAPKLPCRT